MAEWNVTFTIPTDKAADVRDTVSDYLGYQEEIDDGEGNMIPNPQTRPDFVFEKMKDWLRDCYKAGKAQQADIHRRTAIEEADQVDITV
jgi:hypothetical protein